ncbi:MAG: amidohydrolase family protein [Pseudomonadales bacterium]
MMEKYEGTYFDADNHYYEPMDAFTRHVPRRMHRRGVTTAVVDGKNRHIIAGKVDRQVGNPGFNPIAKPGALCGYYRGNPEGKTPTEYIHESLEQMPPEYMDRDARLDRMDEQGVDFAWMFPTLGVMYEYPLQHDIEATCAVFQGFNRWVDEDWGLNYQNRIFCAPYITLVDVDWACREVEWALKQGARIICMRPAPVSTPLGRRSPTHKQYDPFWEIVNEAGITVVAHVGNSGYTGMGYSTGGMTWSGEVQPSIVDLAADRAISDWLMTILYDKLFERFPNLRIASVENGAGFLYDFFRKVAYAKDRSPNFFKEDPIELFKKHVWMNPFWEDHIDEIVGWMGADRVILGSDWPHVEGVARPRDIIDYIHGISLAGQKKMLFTNTAALNELQPA